MTGKNNFCMPIYEETCFLPSETRQACTEFVKKNAWDKIGGAYKNMFDSNVALWQIAYAMAQIMIIITIFILLPIYIIVWIKGRIERFRS
jgi:hypothetical protein